ncbi:amino acid ABC transporter substrate-binding protein [Rhodoferax koreense]|uniref:Amino acid ABC transporter substrate-binding protein n=1 Tax=Rhodoferax koreensis TaxID=1842727 RepID=A0A1P8JSG1_9BURK|nr:transporter substrate-binding domain-containing protein [Rhodoferax koreense]APW36703.1 amino acid ABC transporter substrate-binding protein [Rhodoferax koreense]
MREPGLLSPARRLLLCGLLLPALPAFATDTVKILTEEYPPYNYTDNGVITGLGTEVVQAVLREINVEGQFQSMPWARAYETAQRADSVLIYSMNRSKERENLFKWVGQITPTDFYLFSLKSRNIRINELSEARNLQIGTVNQDVGEQFLVQQGFVVGRNLQSSNRYELNYEKLKRGRIDLWIMNELGAYYMARQAGDDPAATLQKNLRVAELSGGGNYMAFGLKTPDALVERFRKGLEAIKKNGTYDALQRKWL